MNKQLKRKGGEIVSRGIEWCDVTWNPIGGCKHGCRWKMPDGKIAECYAENIAEGIAQQSYPQGFEHHYWHPERLDEPLHHKDPLKIFSDSMSDWMGAWVPDTQILAILNVMFKADWHTYQMLTKNAPRLLKFKKNFQKNLWVLVSSPPDYFMGHELSQNQKEAMLRKQLEVLAELDNVITGMSIEPLSWDISGILEEYPTALDWAILGAASNGPQHYQPDPVHVNRVLDVLDMNNVKKFFKGNLEWSTWYEEFPV